MNVLLIIYSINELIYFLFLFNFDRVTDHHTSLASSLCLMAFGTYSEVTLSYLMVSSRYLYHNGYVLLVSIHLPHH